jgi:TPR repeat protein
MRLIIVFAFCLFSSLVFADANKGLEAYKSGDYATALSEYKKSSDQGDADAQYILGFMSMAKA